MVQSFLLQLTCLFLKEEMVGYLPNYFPHVLKWLYVTNH